MDTIWLVESGELGEAGKIISSHKSFVKAVNAALSLPRQYAGQWSQARAEECMWVNAFDYVKVLQIKLQE